MAMVVLILRDVADGFEVNVMTEQGWDLTNPPFDLTPAQGAAQAMVAAISTMQGAIAAPVSPNAH